MEQGPYRLPSFLSFLSSGTASPPKAGKAVRRIGRTSPRSYTLELVPVCAAVALLGLAVSLENAMWSVGDGVAAGVAASRLDM